MSNIKNNFEDSIRFVAKHYRPGIFNPAKKWAEITGEKPRIIFRPAVWMRVAAAVAILLIAGAIFLQRPQEHIIAAAKNTKTAALPDQSEITLMSGAKLTYDKTFGKENRNVTMSGNIAFKVAHDKEKPFVVHTPRVEITVLGTTFDVSENNEGTQLKVHTGKVNFAPQELPVSFICSKNMSAAYKIAENEVTVLSDGSMCSINGKGKTLIFRNVQLAEVCRVLEQYYKTKLTLPEKEEKLKLTSTFSDKNMDEIVNIINLTLDSHLKN